MSFVIKNSPKRNEYHFKRCVGAHIVFWCGRIDTRIESPIWYLDVQISGLMLRWLPDDTRNDIRFCCLDRLLVWLWLSLWPYFYYDSLVHTMFTDAHYKAFGGSYAQRTKDVMQWIKYTKSLCIYIVIQRYVLWDWVTVQRHNSCVCACVLYIQTLIYAIAYWKDCMKKRLINCIANERAYKWIYGNFQSVAYMRIAHIIWPISFAIAYISRHI